MEKVKDLEDLLAMGCEVKKRLNDAKQSEEEVYVKVEMMQQFGYLRIGGADYPDVNLKKSLLRKSKRCHMPTMQTYVLTIEIMSLIQRLLMHSSRL